ncbi:response regulator transcription factor family protein [Flavobacterium columnare]|nr:response regulator transcription factor family protein [Flavobacterium columnare]AUX18305.1 hypothetical protein AQ623_08470 [Flavobacterium columnare]
MLQQQHLINDTRQQEKKRISQELHDGVMSKLTSTRLNLFILSKRQDPETIQKCLKHIENIQNIEKELRNISHDLNQDTFLEKESFKLIIQNLFEDYCNAINIEYILEMDPNIIWEAIETSTKIDIYRILQESLQNTYKYSHATLIILSIKRVLDRLIIDIEDNGVGFDINKVKEGIGIKNINSRAKSMNGEVKFYSTINKGTHINLSLPTNKINFKYTMDIRILIVDDHPSMIEGYKVILSYNDFGYNIDTTVAYNCESALKLIESNAHFDVAFLDHNLPPYKEGSIENGIDLAKIMRKNRPNTKIVFLTSHSESIILLDMIKRVNPDGILVKSDFTADELLMAFDKIVKGQNYRSLTVDHNVKELLSNKAYLDETNRQIISLLSKGIKTKNIPNYLNLSMSSIEKRKANIKKFLDIEIGSDEDIVRAAKKAGVI